MHFLAILLALSPLSFAAFLPRQDTGVAANVTASINGTIAVNATVAANITMPDVSANVTVATNLTLPAIDVNVTIAANLTLPSIDLNATIAANLTFPTTDANVTVVANITLPDINANVTLGLGLDELIATNASVSCSLDSLSCCAAVGLTDEPTIIDALNILGLSISPLNTGLSLGVNCTSVPTTNATTISASCGATLTCCAGATFGAVGVDGSVSTNCTSVSLGSQ